MSDEENPFGPLIDLDETAERELKEQEDGHASTSGKRLSKPLIWIDLEMTGMKYYLMKILNGMVVST